MSIQAIPAGCVPPGGTSAVSKTAGWPSTGRPAGAHAPAPATGGAVGKGLRGAGCGSPGGAVVVVVVVVAVFAVDAGGVDADARGREVADALELLSGDDERACTAPPHEASRKASAAHPAMTTDVRARRGARRAGTTD
ncbi:MAG: hypothetical protein ACYCSX_11365 [Acidimicrobiales bacterium]